MIERFGTDAAPGSAAILGISETPDDRVGSLAGHGWDADSHTLREHAAAYGRPISTRPQREERPDALIAAVRRQSASSRFPPRRQAPDRCQFSQLSPAL